MFFFIGSALTVPILLFVAMLSFSVYYYIGFYFDDAIVPINFLTLHFDKNCIPFYVFLIILLGSLIVCFALYFYRKIPPKSAPTSIKMDFHLNYSMMLWAITGYSCSYWLILLLKSVPIKTDIFDFIALWNPLAIFVISLLLSLFFSRIITASEKSAYKKMFFRNDCKYFIDQLVKLKEKDPGNEFEKILEERMADLMKKA